MPNAQDQLTSNWMTACVGRLLVTRIQQAGGLIDAELTTSTFRQCVDEALVMAQSSHQVARVPVLRDEIAATTTTTTTATTDENHHEYHRHTATDVGRYLRG